MARSVDQATHAVRRDAFVATATRLFQTQGYDETSIQDILDDLGTSRGAFYHYFDSKTALLDAVVEQMVDSAMRSVEPHLDDPERSALGKLQALFGGIAAWKTAHVELALALTRVWLSDQNALVRDCFRRSVADRLTPRLTSIIAAGVSEGTFKVGDPPGVAEVLMATLWGFNMRATELYLARQAGTVSYEEVARAFGAYADAVDRILGAAPGSFPRADEVLLCTWFG
jgi:AcrR family transcriptional regulator